MGKRYELNDTMMASIIEEAHRLSDDGQMPTMWRWKQCKSEHVPSFSWIEKKLGWSEFAKAAGLKMKSGSEKGKDRGGVSTGWPWYDLLYAIYARATADIELEGIDEATRYDAERFIDYTNELLDSFGPSTVVNGWGRAVTQ